MNEILWLAAADGRGHLMRAHVVRRLLAERGTRVEIVTTSDAGRAFLAELGTPSEVLSRRYAVRFDERQNMDRAGTEACIARYVLSPSGLGRDLLWLSQRAKRVDLVVNDFHPALLLCPHVGAPVVHVHGTHLWRAIAGHFGERGAFWRFAHLLRGRAFGVIEHTLERSLSSDPRHRFVRPILEQPRRVLPRSERLAAVYLNPHFGDPELARAIEVATATAGFALHAVGEGIAPRPGWLARDPDFVGTAAAADVLISAPGMGALSLSHALDLPLIALVSDQPEQLRNLAHLRGAAIRVDSSSFGLALSRALLDVPPRPQSDARPRIAAIHAEWIDAIEALLGRPKPNPNLENDRCMNEPLWCSKPTTCAAEVPMPRASPDP